MRIYVFLVETSRTAPLNPNIKLNKIDIIRNLSFMQDEERYFVKIIYDKSSYHRIRCLFMVKQLTKPLIGASNYRNKFI